MNEKKPVHWDNAQQRFLDAAVALLLLYGFFHVAQISVRRHDIDVKLELDRCREDRPRDGGDDRE